MTTSISIKIEFTGGLETLFSNRKTLPLSLPTSSTISDLISLLASEYVQPERKDLFILDGTVRPGILVLINDSDWELEGEGAYVLQDRDDVVFVSTLHGG